MKKIKVSHIAPTDGKGGADLAGYRLHKAFLNYSEIDSIFFTRERIHQEKEIIKFSNFFLTQIERILNKLGYFTGLQYFFSIDWLPLFFSKRFRKTDVFIIRNIHGGYLPIFFPWLLSKIAPVIWRLPDMWSFTGHCTYSYECDKWKDLCRNCPHLRDYPALFFDTTSFLFKIKKFFYQRSKLYIVCPSTWLFNCVKESPILKNLPTFIIPPGVDSEKFKPELKFDKLSIFFVSNSLKDKRKGVELLPDIFNKLNNKLKEKGIFVDIYIAGEGKINFPYFSQLNIIFLGKLKENELSYYYAKCHLSILPTLADNLPNTILESLSSGTPVVTFDVGGCKDAVLHFKTGYLAKPFDVKDFVNGIIILLKNSQKLGKMSNEARKLVLEKFDGKIQTNLYIKLIKYILYEI